MLQHTPIINSLETSEEYATKEISVMVKYKPGKPSIKVAEIYVRHMKQSKKYN